MSKSPLIVVIGDVMLDRHVRCEVLGISPEDETALKIRVIDAEMKAGGAANVSNNLVSLGARVVLMGCTGTDEESKLLSQVLDSRHSDIVLYRFEARMTTLKSRYITARGRHIVRVDRETTKDVSCDDADMFVETVQTLKPDGVVVSDYAKGVVTPYLMQQLAAYVDPTTITVDPKGSDFTKYGKVGIVTPNLSEFQGIGGRDDREAVKVACCSKHLVVTRGALGCQLFGRVLRDRTLIKLQPYIRLRDFRTYGRDVGDPTGCGDSFLAGLAYKLAQRESLEDACRFANACGACSYDHVGVHAVNETEVVTEMKKHEVQTDSAQ